MRWLVRFALLAAIVATALIVALAIEHRTTVTLPEPTGPFAVGRDVFDWSDGKGRELLVWIWFPAAHGSGSPDDYVPASAQTHTAPRATILSLLTRDVAHVRGHSLRNAAAATQLAPYPVVVMRAGGSSEVVNYSTLAEDLTSHGYVVAGFDAPHRTGIVVFPDGRTFYRTPENNPELVTGEALERLGNRLLAASRADIEFVLDRLRQLNASGKFAGRLDVNRIGVFGHSFGGASALDFCRDGSRCKAAIDIDGSAHGSVIRDGIRTPTMFVLSGNGDFSSAAEVRQIKADLQSIYDRIPPDRRELVVIRGANHFTFSDDGALRKSALLRGVMRLFGVLRIDGRRQLVVTTWCVRSFFDAQLKGVKTPFPSPLYPEVEVGRIP